MPSCARAVGTLIRPYLLCPGVDVADDDDEDEDEDEEGDNDAIKVCETHYRKQHGRCNRKRFFILIKNATQMTKRSSNDVDWMCCSKINRVE